MKNIYILPTNKPSKLHLWTDEIGTRLELFELEYSHTRNTQHIYITNDEEIKEGDWCIYHSGEIVKYLVKLNTDNLKKIILTDNQDLIKDGVQAIDDTFIEWFVKNPSCERVEVKKEMYMPFDGKIAFELSLDETLNTRPYYKINIAKEESKQETLEQAAKKYKSLKLPDDLFDGFVAGAKWNQEQILQFLYSEITERRPYSSSKMCEEVIKFIQKLK